MTLSVDWLNIAQKDNYLISLSLSFKFIYNTFF